MGDRANDQQAGDPLVTAEGAIMGTAAYMAPEMVNGDHVGTAADIYILGGCLFDILTGQPPRRGNNVVEVIEQASRGPGRRPREVNPNVPADLDAICSKAMAFDPAERYPNAAAVAADLRAWLSGRPVSVRPRGPVLRAWDRLAQAIFR
ncbi:MAG: protein kinase [Gemmataceae bacterium]